MITVHMRSQVHPESTGWVIRLKARDPACRATSRPERFGRISHIVKKDGVAVRLLQGASSQVKTELPELSPAQLAILGTLSEIGIIAKVG